MIAARIVLMFAALTAAPNPTGPRYGDTLAANAMAHDHAIRGLRIAATTTSGETLSIVSGDAPDSVGATLCDAMGTPIGTVSVAGRADPAVVSAYLSRRIYVVANLGEPDPFVPGTTRSRLGQQLVETMLARFPDLVSIAFHVALPGRPNRIIASSFGRIGKLGDKDDARVAADGAVLREVTDGGRRLAVELPLLDWSGRTIGALSTSFVVASGTDPQQRYQRGLSVRDALRRLIPSLGSLA